MMIQNTRSILLMILLVLVWGWQTSLYAAERGLARNPSAKANKRFALIVGNSHYSNLPNLVNPGNDARDISQSLSKLGFKTDLLVDADQETIESKIVEFGRKLSAGGVGLFYYAGHGIQSKGRNYLIPANANLRSEKDLRYKAVDVGQVLSEMENANNGFNIVILDACRNNPLASQFRSATRGLTRVNAPRGTLVAFATGPGEAAEDGQGRNGTFTKYFLKALNISNISIEQTFKTVLKNVDKETHGRQTPWVSSSFTGDFYFNTTLPTVSQSQANKIAARAPIENAQQVAMAQTTTLQSPEQKSVAPAIAIENNSQIKHHQGAPSSLSTQYKFDGKWEGHFDCGENPRGFHGWRRYVTLTLRKHKLVEYLVDLSRAPAKKLKKLHHALPDDYFISDTLMREPAIGSISRDGEFNIKYDFIFNNDVFDVYLDGGFNGEKFILSGQHANRDCEMTLYRASE